MEWIYLLLAILFEIAGTISMKFAEGFTKFLPSLLIALFYIPSFGLFTIAIKRIDIGVAYAVWSGLGTAMIALIGWFFFRETISPVKVISLALIIIGVIGLNLSGASH